MDMSTIPSDNSTNHTPTGPELTDHSAGGLVYRLINQQIEICMIKDSYGRWTFPKGHLEPDETSEAAAKREISEETGLPLADLILKDFLGEIDYYFNSTFESDGASVDEPKKIHKYVSYYLFEVPAAARLTAQPGEVEDIAWVPLAQMDERNEYEDNWPIIEKAKRFFSPQ